MALMKLLISLSSVPSHNWEMIKMVHIFSIFASFFTEVTDFS